MQAFRRFHHVSEDFEIQEILRKTVGERSYAEFLRVPAMSAGIYRLAVGTSDLQKPHEEDEIYFVSRGKAKIQIGSRRREVSEGLVILVEARADHHFYDIEQELVLLVVFAPAESS
jgi:mannose-6-phosphate isomerase-like protein (cupin superfamily)